MRRWSKEEVDFLKENYDNNIPLVEIAKKIGRTRKSLIRKAQRMKIRRSFKRFVFPEKKFTRKEIEQRYFQKNKKSLKERKLARRKKLKEDAVNNLGGKCNICGYNKCLAALEFHH